MATVTWQLHVRHCASHIVVTNIKYQEENRKKKDDSHLNCEIV